MSEECLAPARSTCCAKRSALRARKPNSFMKDFLVTSRPSSPYANCTTDLRPCASHERTSRFRALTPTWSVTLSLCHAPQMQICKIHCSAGGKASRHSGFCAVQASSRASPIAIVPDCVVVVDAERLEVLDEAALQVARSGSLHCCVYQPLAPSHAVEVVLLQSPSSSEATESSILAVLQALLVHRCQSAHEDVQEGPARHAKLGFWVFTVPRRCSKGGGCTWGRRPVRKRSPTKPPDLAPGSKGWKQGNVFPEAILGTRLPSSSCHGFTSAHTFQ